MTRSPRLNRAARFRNGASIRGGVCGLLFLAAFAAPAAEERPAPVETVVVRKSAGELQTLPITGTVTARRQARLSSRTTGLIESMKVDAGSRVKPGDVLVTLDTDLAEISLDLIRSQIAQARIELEEAQRREEEVRDLVKSGGFAKSEAETRKSAVRIGEAGLQQLLVREREQAETIARHQLIAPFGGVISRKLAEDGEWVTTGTPVLELVETDSPRFDLQVPQEFLGRVAEAESVTVMLDAFLGRPIPARIGVVVPVKDAVSRTFLLRLELDDPQGLAAPGMSGSARIVHRPSRTDTVSVPRDALMRFPDGKVKVWIVSQTDGLSVVAPREVQTGESHGDFVEVVSGLEGGETVVLKGNESLRDGQIVLPGETPTAAPAP